MSIKGILDVHDLHIWAITSDKISLTAHLVIDSRFKEELVRDEVQLLLLNQFKISHTTLQTENKKTLSLCNRINNNE